MSDHNSKANNNANGESIGQVEVNESQSETRIESGCADKEIEVMEEGGAPIDRGWAWVVLAACVFEIVIYGGLMRSFGVFFLQYQLRFNSNASETAVMSMIQNIVLSTTALFVMTIGLRKFSSRASVFIGGTVTVAGYLITAYTTDIGVFYFAQGVLAGSGLALIHPPMLAIIGEYFKKHRGLANSIFTGGGSVGGLIFAPVVIKLFDEYKYTGTLLICSGLLMNIWVAALLMRPIESYTKKKIKSKDEATEITEEDQILLKDVSLHDNVDRQQIILNEIKVESGSFKNGSNSQITKIPVDFIRMQSFDPEIMQAKSHGSPLLQRVRAHSFGLRSQRTVSENNCRYDSENNIHHSKNVFKGLVDAISRSQVAIYTSGEGICGSFIDINIPASNDLARDNVNVNDNEHDEMDAPKGCCLKLKSCICSVLCTVFDLSLLRNPVFLTYLLMAFSIMSGVSLLPVYIPTHAKDIGISNEKIGLLISLMAVVDLVSKLTMGVVADRQWIKRSTILVIITFVIGTASHLMRYVNTFPAMIVFVMIAGLCCGQYLSIYAVLLMEVIGPEKFRSSLGFGTLVHGTSVAVFFPLAGLLRDTTGSYVASFHLLGGLSYLACVLAFIIPIVNKWKMKRDKEENKDHGDKT